MGIFLFDTTLITVPMPNHSPTGVCMTLFTHLIQCVELYLDSTVPLHRRTYAPDNGILILLDCKSVTCLLTLSLAEQCCVILQPTQLLILLFYRSLKRTFENGNKDSHPYSSVGTYHTCLANAKQPSYCK
jgi:hypothetical protein